MVATGEYIVLNSVVYALFTVNNRVVFNTRNGLVVYEPSVDGRAYSREEIEKEYPEWCI
jgi:hypothetical protein